MSRLEGTGCKAMVSSPGRALLPDIERSIIKKYRKTIWSKFTKAIKDYNMIQDGDRIAVAISGGKDSTLMAKVFQELKRHGNNNFALEFMVMDPGYHPDIKRLLISNCEYLNISIHLFESDIFKIVDNIAPEYPCYLCAKMRRGALYTKAQELGCNKLALGHHFNDIIETTLLNLFYAGTFKTMLPKLKASHFENLELIRPLYYIEEKYIENFTRDSGICPLNCACMVAAERTGNKRYEIKDLIQELKKKYRNIDKLIMKSTQNVNMDCILGWQKEGKRYSYLDYYDE